MMNEEVVGAGWKPHLAVAPPEQTDAQEDARVERPTMIESSSDELQQERALLGKIARLPRAIREQVNQRLEDGQPSSVIVPWLNELPQVKKVMAKYFGGAEINHRNISNWRATGYKRWVRKQEELAELKELVEDARDYSDAAGKSLARGLASLAAAKILKMLHDLPPEKCGVAELTKIAFAVAALVKGDQNYERLKHEQVRVYQGNERLVLSWDKHMRTCVEVAQRVLNDKLAAEIQDSDLDNAEKIELLGYHLFGRKWHGRRVGRRNEDGEWKAEEGGENETEGKDEDTVGTRFCASAADREVRPTTIMDSSAMASEEASGMTPNAATETVALPVSACERKIEADGQTDAREDARVERPTTIPAISDEAQQATLPKPVVELNAYEKARLEGKTHLEAMYAMFIPVKDRPPVQEPIPCEPPMKYYAMSRVPEPQRPPPGFNSLG